MKLEHHRSGVDKSTVQTPVQEQPVRLLQRGEVEHLTGLSRSLIYELVKAGSFPVQVKLTANRVGWVSSEIDEWIAQKVRSRGK